jgi:acetyl-CoA carboxylase carboxyl transferase subunit beta
MSILAWIEDRRKLKLLNAPKYNQPASDGSQGLWTRCDHCGVILYIKHLKENQRVCFGCGYHLQMNSQERIEHLIDSGTWRPLDEILSPCDPLEFRDQKQYTERLKEAQERTGLQDAVQTGTGMLDGIPIALGVMDFNFMGGSMGSVVGEKITRLIEYATQEGLTLILVCASGGARMQEGIFSLMQMAKISAALQIYQSCANLLYISVLTSPTTGGVTASFAMLGDLIFAEPKALIGFAGRRVIEQTLQEQLPDDFQTAEYLLHHGLLDLIVPRSFLKQALSETITLYKDAPFKEFGIIPYGTQQNLYFFTEEKIRRKFKDWEKNFIIDSSWILQNGTENQINELSSNELEKNTFDSNSFVPQNKGRVLTQQEFHNSENTFNKLYFFNKKSYSDSCYREILLSFQTIVNFFDKKNLSKQKNISSENEVNKLSTFTEASALKYERASALKYERVKAKAPRSLMGEEKFLEVLKNLKKEDSLIDKVLVQNSNIETKNFSQDDKNVQRVQKFLHNAIFLAGKEHFEWRTLYFSKNVQSKKSFVQNLTNSTSQKDIFKKNFFYKRICSPPMLNQDDKTKN